MIATRSEDAADGFDRGAFIAAVEPVLPAAYRLAVAMLRSETEAEDAVQDAVLNAWRHHDRFRAGAQMKPWLLAIVANECRWYDMYFRMDPSVRQYTGPGTYAVRADITPLGGDPIFEGDVNLKVNSHNPGFGPWTGSVNGTLTWTGASTQPYAVTISGNWSCTWSDNLGPG